MVDKPEIDGELRGWVSARDPKTNRVYYHNEVSFACAAPCCGTDSLYTCDRVRARPCGVCLRRSRWRCRHSSRCGTPLPQLLGTVLFWAPRRLQLWASR